MSEKLETKRDKTKKKQTYTKPVALKLDTNTIHKDYGCHSGVRVH